MEVKRQPSSKRPRFSNADKEEEKTRTMSRIFRVSRASGGKDRHSKVFTSKGLRDRRVRLSVSTAIEFYDLQDRLGFDQPSKAIEWLIKAASSAIAQLPSLVSSFPELAEGSKMIAEAEPGCSSTSETSKGSVLSLSRSEIRIKARERARLRTAKDKEEKGEDDGDHLDATEQQHPQNMNQSSFTELLIAGSSTERTQIQEILRPSTVTADYFGQAGFFARTQLPSSFCSTKNQIFGTSSPVGMMPYNIASATGDNSDMQQFSFINEHMDYNLNFPGFHRGTLQSNPSLHSPFSPSSSSMDVPFIFGAAAPSTEPHFYSIFDSRLQLSKEPITPFCLEGYRPPDLKGKRKN